MKLENQVCSLDLAKRLKELGVKQESYFWWTIPEGKYVEVFMRLNPAYEDDNIAPTKVQLTENPDFYGNYGEPVNKVPAFTVAELGEMLPDLYKSYRYAGTQEWCVNLEEGARDKRKQYPNMLAGTEADARAKMLNYLLENHLLLL
jgi:hypothetical protein